MALGREPGGCGRGVSPLGDRARTRGHSGGKVLSIWGRQVEVCVSVHLGSFGSCSAWGAQPWGAAGASPGTCLLPACAPAPRLPMGHGRLGGAAGADGAVVPLFCRVRSREDERLPLTCVCSLFNPENLICHLQLDQQLRKEALSSRAMDSMLLPSS